MYKLLLLSLYHIIRGLFAKFPNVLIYNQVYLDVSNNFVLFDHLSEDIRLHHS